MKIGLEKKKFPNSLIAYLLTLLLVVYFKYNPLAPTPQLKPMNSTSVRKRIVYRFTSACSFIRSSLLCDLNESIV
jgi:hypothetical protein